MLHNSVGHYIQASQNVLRFHAILILNPSQSAEARASNNVIYHADT